VAAAPLRSVPIISARRCDGFVPHLPGGSARRSERGQRARIAQGERGEVGRLGARRKYSRRRRLPPPACAGCRVNNLEFGGEYIVQYLTANELHETARVRISASAMTCPALSLRSTTPARHRIRD
jgi:hypothetical protein